MLMTGGFSMPLALMASKAGEGGHSGLAQREIVRRQQAVVEADRLFNESRESYTKADYEAAVNKSRQALDLLPEAPGLADRRKSYTQHLSDASVALVRDYRKIGKYTEARAVLEGVLAPNIDPDNAAAKQELGFLDDPIRTNPALTFEHTKNVDAVRRGLYTAEGHYNLGNFNEAKREYQDVLRKDPFNSAARRGLERLAAAKSDYYRAAYDQTRAELLMEVDRAWELAVRADVPTLNPVGEPDLQGTAGVAYITEKLRRIIIPRIDFEDTTVEEAVDFLRMRSAELDTFETDPAKKGVNFIVRRPRASSPATQDVGTDPALGTGVLAAPAADPSTIRIRELRVRNVPLQVALQYICDAAKLRPKIDDFSVTLVPLNEPGEDFFSRTFRVSPDFSASLEAASGGSAGAGAAPDPFAPDTTASASKIGVRRAIKDLLMANGITFAEGTSATITPNGALVIRNTPSELEKIEGLVEAMRSGSPKQVKITSKFVEISQENTDELGFDWIVSPFGLSANNLFGSGGTIGSGGFKGSNDFVNSIEGYNLPSFPSDSTSNVTNIMTGGLRSGDSAINGNSIDSILNNPNRNSDTGSAAPGIAALTGLFSDGQVQVIMRGLAQKKGVDVMTAPSVMAKSGQKAKIEIIREFIYPTEYEPPELPNSVGSTGSSTTTGSSSQSFPVTPATPTAFETRNTGVTLEIEPTIGDNDFVIDLQFVPEIVEFEGFINYGSPIQSPSTDILGNAVVVTITENRIEMPVFSTRRVNTSLTIYDGYTVAVGGLMREDIQTVEDKVPILGDIPIIGRLFQSKADNRIKSNLMMFVTAQIIDATGRPLRGADSMPASIPLSTEAESGTGVLPPIAPN